MTPTVNSHQFAAQAAMAKADQPPLPHLNEKQPMNCQHLVDLYHPPAKTKDPWLEALTSPVMKGFEAKLLVGSKDDF